MKKEIFQSDDVIGIVIKMKSIVHRIMQLKKFENEKRRFLMGVLKGNC